MVSQKSDIIPFHQQQAIQILLRAGMSAGNIMGALRFLHELKAIENVPHDVLPCWIEAVRQLVTQSPHRSNVVIYPSHNDQKIRAAVTRPALEIAHSPSFLPNQFTVYSTIEPPSRMISIKDDEDYGLTASNESHPSSLSTTFRQRRVPKFVPRHCIGSNGKCIVKSRQVWKYQSPWESHFRCEHLNDFLDVPTCTYICFCSPEDRGNASDLMKHVWDTHMANSANTQPTTFEF